VTRAEVVSTLIVMCDVPLGRVAVCTSAVPVETRRSWLSVQSVDGFTGPPKA
jgi:hypothetical protein